MVASSPYLLRGQGACAPEEAAAPSEEVAPSEEALEHALTLVQGEALGTTWTVKVVSPEGPPPDEAAVRTLVDAQLALVDAQMSTWRPDSELSRFNAHDSSEPFPISPEHAEVLRHALAVHAASEGAFDVTVRPLVRRWGFGAGGDASAPPPGEDELEALRQVIGSERLSLTESTLSKAVPQVEVDLSAIAKGYAVDLVSDALTDAGMVHHMVEVGGEVQARGQNKRSEPWRIAVERPATGLPLERRIEEVVALSDLAMATSGDYRDYREVDGVRVSHTVDPRTGRPIRHALASVTVLHERCVLADAWATALNVLGPEEGLAVAEREGLAVLLLVRHADGSFGHVPSAAFSAHQADPDGDPVAPPAG